MRRLNGWLTIFWIVMIPVSIMLGLLASVTYVSALSLWALVSGHWCIDDPATRIADLPNRLGSNPTG